MKQFKALGRGLLELGAMVLGFVISFTLAGAALLAVSSTWVNL